MSKMFGGKTMNWVEHNTESWNGEGFWKRRPKFMPKKPVFSNSAAVNLNEVTDIFGYANPDRMCSFTLCFSLSSGKEVKWVYRTEKEMKNAWRKIRKITSQKLI